MAQLTVTLAEDILDDATFSGSSFNTSQKHRAIRAAVRRFIRETNCDTELLAITFTSGTKEFDIAGESGWEDFVSDQFIHLHHDTDGPEIKATDYRDINRKYNGQAKTGKPTHFAWTTRYKAILYPTPDANYACKMLKRNPAVAISIGGSGTEVINIPEEWVDDVITYGAHYYLIKGSATEREAAATALARFDALIAQAAPKFPRAEAGVTEK